MDAQGLVKHYKGNPVVDGITLAVRSGEIFGILGPNGAGKTTTVRMIAGLTRRSAGRLRVLGYDPSTDGTRLRRLLGILPQFDGLDPDLSTRDNVIYYGRLFGVRRRSLASTTDELLEAFGLAPRAGDRISELSGGMRRRLGLVRALVTRPALLLLDEPSTGLDPQARRFVWEYLRSLRLAGTSQIVTTHFMDEAQSLCDRLIVLDSGRIVAEGDPDGIVRSACKRDILELRFGAERVDRAFDSLATHFPGTERRADVVQVHSDDGSETLRMIERMRLGEESRHLRQSTLEDAFLALTGRALV